MAVNCPPVSSSCPEFVPRRQNLVLSGQPDREGGRILIDDVEGLSIECDEEDADELEALIESFNHGTRDQAQFEQALAEFSGKTFASTPG